MGWARGASFSLVSLTSFHRVNTVILSSLPLPLSLSDSPFPYPSPLSPSPSLSLSLSRVFFSSLFHTHTCLSNPNTRENAVESFFWLTLILHRRAAARLAVEWLLQRGKKLLADRVAYSSPVVFLAHLDPRCLEAEAENVCFIYFFFSPPAIQGSVALSQLKKRHEINVMSMAFFSWNPKALSQSHLAWCSHPLTVQWEWDGGCLSGNTVSMWCPLVAGRCIHSSAFRFFFVDRMPVRHFIWEAASFSVESGRQWNAFSPRTGSSCGVFLPFDVILEVISSFPSPGPHLTAPSPPSPAKARC